MRQNAWVITRVGHYMVPRLTHFSPLGRQSRYLFMSCDVLSQSCNKLNGVIFVSPSLTAGCPSISSIGDLVHDLIWPIIKGKYVLVTPIPSITILHMGDF